MTRLWAEVVSAVTDKRFWLIGLAVALGWYRAPWWYVPIFAVLLTLWSTIADEKWLVAFKRIDRLDALAFFWVEALAMNVLLVGVAYGLGFAVLG